MLNFIGKTRTRKTATKEMAIRLNLSGTFADGSKKHNVAFRFYDDSHKKICGDTEHMEYAIDEANTRIYFKESDTMNGYKAAKTNAHSATTSRTVTVAVRDTDFWSKCVGDYNLLYDRDEKLYYVDYSRNVKK